MAEYAYNTAVSEATKFSPFEANYGFQPQTQWVGVKENVTWNNPASKLLLSRWRSIWDQLTGNLREAQQRMTKWFDRKAMTQPQFKVGDKVMVDARNMKTLRPTKKLDHKKVGPLKVIRLVHNRACQLELPPNMFTHDVFSVGLLEPYKESEIPGRRQSPPPPEVIKGDWEFEVESIGKSRKNGRKKRVEYLVFWKGYPPSEATWEPLDNLEGATELVENFHEEYPDQARD
jgi:hypothetical protein